MRADWPASIGVIGAGRLGTALAMALDQAGYPVRLIWSRTEASRNRLAGLIERASAAGSAQELAERSDLIFIAVADDAIRPVADSIAWRPGTSVVHCSGALESSVLSHAERLGASVGSFHPLQSFPDHAETDRFNGVTVAIEGEPDLCAALRGIATRLGARPLLIPAGAKGSYHLAAVMASNYLVTLIDLAARSCEPLGLSRSEALDALMPLSRATLENVARLGGPAALTGPIARGDPGTIIQHHAALDARDSIDRSVYDQLGLATVRLAAERGALTEDQIQKMKRLLIERVTQERTASCA